MNSIIVEIFKIFFNRKLTQSLIALIFATMTFLLVPEEFIILSKLGTPMFIIGSFGIFFLGIEIIVYLVNSIKKILTSKENKRYLNETKEHENEETLEKLWTIVDSMSVSDRELLIFFLENENQPYIHDGTWSEFGNCRNLLESDWVYKTEIKEKLEENGDEFNPIQSYYYVIKQKFILKPVIYNILKYSQEHYGRISHFD